MRKLVCYFLESILDFGDYKGAPVSFVLSTDAGFISQYHTELDWFLLAEEVIDSYCGDQANTIVCADDSPSGKEMTFKQCFLYENKIKIDNYIKHLDEVFYFPKNRKFEKLPLNSFSAKILMPNLSEGWIIHNCIIYEGVLVELVSLGSKRTKSRTSYCTADNTHRFSVNWHYSDYAPKPLFCPTKFDSLAQRQAAEQLSSSCMSSLDWTPCFDQYYTAMFKMGDNGYGYIVKNYDKEIWLEKTSKTVNLTRDPSGKYIFEGLTEKTWDAAYKYIVMDEYGYFDWDRDIYEMRKLGNNRYSIHPEHIRDFADFLLKVNWKISFDNKLIKTYDEFANILDSLFRSSLQIGRKLTEPELLARKQQEAKRKEFQIRFNELAWEYMDATDTFVVDLLNKFLIKVLISTGATSWRLGLDAKIDNKFLYKINQPNDEGCRMKLSNYKGLFVFRVPLTENIEQLLEEINTHEKNENYNEREC